MSAKKSFILPVIFSIISHALLLSAAGFVEIGFLKAKQEMAIWVNLPQTEEIQEETREREAVKALPTPLPEEEATGNDEPTEETVNLDSPDQRFSPYLLMVKQRISRIWSYPSQAFAQGKGGTSTVRFTLASDGALVACKIVTPSGSAVLDRETVNVVRAAAPYEPFPEDFNISRLHIMATFRYRFVQ